MRVLRTLLLLMLLLPTVSTSAELRRWYSADQVDQGQRIYRSKCARCHGDQAEGEADWRELDAEGVYPAPPLDGSAYAWRHNMEQLRHQIETGSESDDADMPSFKHKLSDADIDSVIAFLQSKWNDTTYQAWRRVQLTSATQQRQNDVKPLQHPVTFWLKHHLSAARIDPGKPKKTPVRGVREVTVNNQVLYLSEDGRYAFAGDLIDLLDGSNLTRLNNALETRGLVKTYAPGNMLVYPATAEEKTYITIFTDTSCAYCRKMHGELPELQSNGVTVRLIPYPRHGIDGAGYQQLKSIWCSAAPIDAFNSYIEDQILPADVMLSECDDDAVDSGYELGNRLGISGTPLLVLENGRRIEGYKPADDVLYVIKLPPGQY